MKPAPFQYHAPQTIAETLELLAQYARRRPVLAGGQSLVPTMAFRLARPKHLVDINGVAGLDLVVENGRLCIGAGCDMPHSKSVEEGPLGRCSPRSSGISRICPSVPAARSAAASPTPTPPRNGAR